MMGITSKKFFYFRNEGNSDIPTFRHSDFRSGQTLIETLVAVFMLVMGVSAAVGLAIFAFNSSTSITKQIIAIGLAREGAEAIKNMRDTNWLKSALSSTCYNYVTLANNAKCYTTWLNQPTGGYNIAAPAAISLRLTLNPASSGFWSFRSAVDKWGLDFDPNLSCAGSTCGFYIIPDISTGLTNGSSEYYRKIIITEDTTAPYNQANLQRLKVQSQVWWTDKKCPRVQDFSAASTACRVEIDTNLTNWKDY